MRKCSKKVEITDLQLPIKSFLELPLHFLGISYSDQFLLRFNEIHNITTNNQHNNKLAVSQ